MDNIVSNYIGVFKKYAQFSGRAGRREYWMFVATNVLLSLVLGIVDGITGIPVLGLLFMLVALLPSIAVTIRRLHDTNRTGWWMLVACVPIVGAIVLLVLMALPSTRGSNAYGETPREDAPSMATA